MGKVYSDGEVIIQQGSEGERMYVVQDGEVEILRELEEGHVRLSILSTGDFFGEVPLFERAQGAGEVRATARALGEARVLTVDKKTMVRRIHEDPSLAYRILEIMSRRVRELEGDMVRLVTGVDS
jgi:CRP/FNR family transcriptional regulator, cyclic AMP receptor protein